MVNTRFAPAICVFILLLPVAALTSDAPLTKLLDEISTSLASSKTLWQLSYDPDFPCSITLTEHSKQDTNSWTKRYVFELSDISPGQLLNSKDGRRAISYYGEKTTADGAVKSYSPKKISALNINAGETGKKLQAGFDEAIRICEEKNQF